MRATADAGKNDAALQLPAASPSTIQSNAKPLPTAVPTRDVNLLHEVPTRIAVSSTVKNPHDFPEYLIDNHLETAWNGRTGDLVGGWIEFELPADVSVHAIELTSGYSRVKGNVDLFLANHRISRVEVLRNGESLGEFPLDVKQRNLQRLPITTAGGKFRVVVKATVAGTRKDWRELAVSELRVLGLPGKELRQTERRLQVAVGGLDEPLPDDLLATGMAIREIDAFSGAFATVEALCGAFVSRARAGAGELLESVSGIGITELETPFCRVIAERNPIPPNPIYTEPTTVFLSDGLWKRKQLAVKVRRGFVLFPSYWDSEDPTDPGCPSIFRAEKLASIRVENGYLVVTEEGYRQAYVEGDKTERYTLHGATWCKEADDKLSCLAYDPQNVGSLGDFAIAPDGTLHQQ
ncbi:MAG: hypothetical protein QM784_32900 [Polyangiaceae bacterium]